MDALNDLTIEQIRIEAAKAIDAPWIRVTKAALGDDVFIRVSLQHDDEWAHGIMENSTNASFLLTRDGELENWKRFDVNFPRLRKVKGYDLPKMLKRINDYVQNARKVLPVE